MFPPKKNTAFTLVLVIRDADGDPVSGASALDSEVSIDGGSFSDCTNEATEIGSSGIYTLALTSGEMNGDVIVVQTKTSSSGAKTAVNVIYTAAATVDDLSGRIPSALVSGRMDASVGAMANNVLTAAAINADAITAAKVASDVGAEFADAVWDEALSGHTTAGSAGKQLGDVAVGSPPSAAAVADAVWDEALSGHTTGGSAGKALSDASTGSAPTATDVADAVLSRGLANVEDTADDLSLAWMIAKGVSKIEFDDAANTLKVYKSDGSTLLFTQATTQAASMKPITALGVGA